MVIVVDKHSLELEHILLSGIDLRHGRQIVVVRSFHLAFVIVAVDAHDAVVIDRKELAVEDDAVTPYEESCMVPSAA